ncbi:ankyrin [Corynespora cassiicola Philippines]|uniref:Ankyrin n=1 Tax=Corynespora cassiicola Philippines TaxID=1448308 RepID=A0A2T2NQA1_CORCC|nr:ankyrin [Corynespora cassiicola Philippines]
MDEGAPVSPIRVALKWWNHNSVRALLTLTWAASPTDFYPSESELNSLIYAYNHCYQQARSYSSISDLFFNWGSEKDILTLVRCGTFGDSDISSTTRHSLLAFTVDRGYVTVTEFLLSDPRVDCNRQDRDGFTPLIKAAREGREKIVPLLLECAQIDVNLQDTISQTALSYATMNGHEDIVSRLLGAKQVDINSQDNIHGRTPLIFALENGYHNIARLILTRPDIDVNICTKAGKSPLDFARRGGMQEETNMIARLIRAKRHCTSSVSKLSEADN